MSSELAWWQGLVQFTRAQEARKAELLSELRRLEHDIEATQRTIESAAPGRLPGSPAEPDAACWVGWSVARKEAVMGVVADFLNHVIPLPGQPHQLSEEELAALLAVGRERLGLQAAQFDAEGCPSIDRGRGPGAGAVLPSRAVRPARFRRATDARISHR